MGDNNSPFPDDDRYFMAIALLSERRSKDPVRQVGACIVNNEPRAIAIGYNGMPLRCQDKLMDWSKGKKPKGQVQENKHSYVCHAEMNAIVNLNPVSCDGRTIYVTLYPCNECAKVLIHAGVKRVVYLSFDGKKKRKPEFKCSRMLLKENGIEVIEYSDPQGSPIMNLLFQEEQNQNDLSHYKPGDKFLDEKLEDAEFKEQFMGIISWEQYFMALAILAKDMKSVSNNGRSKEGACVVNEDDRIVGLGYLKNLLKTSSTDTVSPAKRAKKRAFDSSLSVLHAPVCAIVSKSPLSLRNCSMYVTQFPCPECAKLIVQSGIKTVIYLTGDVNTAVDRMFGFAKVKYTKYRYEEKRILLDFSKAT